MKYIKLYEELTIRPKDIITKVIKPSSSDLKAFQIGVKKAIKGLDTTYADTEPVKFVERILKWKIGSYVYVDMDLLKYKYGESTNNNLNFMFKEWKLELEQSNPDLYKMNIINKLRWNNLYKPIQIYPLLPMLWPSKKFDSLKPYHDKIMQNVYAEIANDAVFKEVTVERKEEIIKNYIDPYFNELFKIVAT